ncbi:MAG: glycosyltransferase family 2 protein [Acidobacteriales bacterium]|nr:MAG: glycosyltransferase family 2 protein [Terriglobales bacterium]
MTTPTLPEPLPLVSVIIPVYNGNRFLGDALRSVVRQEYPALEIIVVDDGSTDGSAQNAAAFAGVRCLSQPNQGPGVARNAGIEQARGEIIALLDQDDEWASGKLRAQVAALVADPGLDLSLSYTRTFLEPGTNRPSWLTEEQTRLTKGFFPGSLATRREVFARIGLFNPAYRFSSDAGLRFAYTEGAWLLRRIHSENQSNHVQQLQKELLEIARQSLQRKRGQGGAS